MTNVPPSSNESRDQLPTNVVSSSTSQLRQMYATEQTLFQNQPVLVQRFLEMQGRQVTDAIVQRLSHVRFTLPDRITYESESSGEKKIHTVPADFREQMAGGIKDRIARTDIRIALRQRLNELEQSTNRAVSLSAGLIRYTTVGQMVQGMLPSGRSVTYKAAEGEEIPTLPVSEAGEAGSAITAATDAIVEEGGPEEGRGELLVPYVPAARRFYLPQWVAFDDQGNLLVNSLNEAEAHLASMQNFLFVLHAAVSLAPYVVVDEEYQKKRYGMLGQLVNQGRALALYEVNEIVRMIKRRSASHDLNRGLSLSLPYFDDQELEMRTLDFEVIPAGRIMFVPAFVVLAAREEQVKVAQDTRLSPSTRKYLLAELRLLEQAFESSTRT